MKLYNTLDFWFRIINLIFINFFAKLQIMVLNDEDYPIYHNTLVHKAIDIAGLELVSERDFSQRNLYDFILLVQFQLNVACEVCFH